MRRSLMGFGALALAVALAAPARAQTKLLRFPDIHDDRVVFVHGGDLWTADATTGGLARRLTSHPGQELFPKFSPDGEWIAFTGQYDGDEQVYVMPAAGGSPRQLTFYPANGPLPPRWGYDHQVYGWTPDGKSILFRSFRDTWDISDTRLFTVAAAGGLPTALAMPKAGAGDFSGDGERIVYSPLARDFRSWKRYEGGWAQDLYLFDLSSHESRRLTDHPRSDRDPMWIGDTIYFVSDRDGTLNLYAQDLTASAARRVTDSATWDVRWPSADSARGRIVYEMAGELAVLDTASGRSRTLSIQVPSDGLARRPSRISVADNIQEAGLSPKGERVLFVARGDLFTAPIENGPTRNLTRTSDAHERQAQWSPDGRSIAYFSDATGEEELYVIAQDGSGEPRQLTDDGQRMRFNPVWSPDNRHIAFSDSAGKLFVVEVESRDRVEVADEDQAQIGNYSWSLKGDYLTFSMADPNGHSSIWIWSRREAKLHRVTDELFNDFSPAWGSEGDFLYFLSDRDFAPQLGSIEWNYSVDRETSIYALALRKDVAHPFPPQSDEVTLEKPADDAGSQAEDGAEKAEAKGKKARKGKKKGSAGEDEKPSGDLAIDFSGLAQRVVRLPVEADNYVGLSAVPGHLIYANVPAFFYGRNFATPPSLRIFSLEDREATVLADGIAQANLSADGSKVLIAAGGGWQLLDAKPSGKGSGKAISTAGLAVDRVPAEEWEQIFDEVWRRFRDWFYVENMHGYDWQEIGERYRSLLGHVAHRSDLNYLMSEMIGELNISHAYVVGGDYEIPERVPVGLPGARFELDETAGRYRIAEILEGDNAENRYRSPLTEVGVDVEVGDYILAIDGEELAAATNPYRLLQHRVGAPVELTVNDRADMDGARQVTFSPLRSERELVYHDWVMTNYRKVQEATDGRVGYLHIPDMGPRGIREFIKWFYGQIRKEGLVVDVRGNGGGNVSSMIIERLGRKLTGLGYARNNDVVPTTYPQHVFHGHMVCLLNETSASDGDIFPYMFRESGLGPLIGKRSWGGVVGITGRGPLIDGGGVSVPEFGMLNTAGEWVVEGYGVDPDIVVENDPKSVIEGRDPQLERGIAEVLERIRAEPKTLPPHPAPPVKTP